MSEHKIRVLVAKPGLDGHDRGAKVVARAPRIVELLKANGQDKVKVFIGGIVPDEDMPRLKEMGITGIYGPGASTEDIVKDILEAMK